MALFRKRVGGVIGSLGLGTWYLSLAPAEREQLRECYTFCARTDGLEVQPENMDRGRIGYGRTAAHFLWSVAARALQKGWLDLGEGMLLHALRVPGSAVDYHFARNHLINLYARMRHERSEALTRCVQYCQQDVAAFPQYIESLKAAVWSEPRLRIPAMELLPDLYVEMGRFEEAIEACQRALDLGVWDHSRGGFDRRIRQIQAL